MLLSQRNGRSIAISIVLLASCSRTTTPPAPASTPSTSSSVATATATPRSSASVIAASVPSVIDLPAGTPGIGFDDLRYAPTIDRVLAPAARSGNLDLVDPQTFAVTALSGFSAEPTYGGGHDFGVTSADEGNGLIFATDRTSQKLVVVDEKTSATVSSTPLGAHPDYVRWVAATKEVWVTEPDTDRIEIFSIDGTTAKSVATIAVPGGPESLVVDAWSGVAYTHLWKGATVAIDVKTRKVGAAWKNGCEGSRGIDFDHDKNLVFAGCSEGKLVALDAKSGAVRSSVDVGAGVDVIAYDAKRGHLYAPGGKAATTAIVSVASDGALKLLGNVPAATGSHCVTTDLRGRIYVCDPSKGRLLVSVDAY